MCIGLMSDVVSPVCALKLQPTEGGDAAPEIQNVNEHVDHIKSKLRLPSPEVQKIKTIIDDHCTNITKFQAAGRVLLAKKKLKSKRAEAAAAEQQRNQREAAWDPIRSAMDGYLQQVNGHVQQVQQLITQVDEQIRGDATAEPATVTPDTISTQFQELLTSAKAVVDKHKKKRGLFGLNTGIGL